MRSWIRKVRRDLTWGLFEGWEKITGASSPIAKMPSAKKSVPGWVREAAACMVAPK